MCLFFWLKQSTKKARIDENTVNPGLAHYLEIWLHAAQSANHYIIPKCFNASLIAFSLCGGHFGCLAFSDFGLL